MNEDRLGLIWLMFGRTRRREAERFIQSVQQMRTEAESVLTRARAEAQQHTDQAAQAGQRTRAEADGYAQSTRMQAEQEIKALREKNQQEITALRYYRGLRPRDFLRRPRQALQHLHGDRDGCMGTGVVRERAFPPGSRIEIVDGVGHFLHLEDPDRVNGLISRAVGAPR